MPGKVPGGTGKCKQRRKCPDTDFFEIFGKFQQPDPAVTAGAIPDELGIEHHFIDIPACIIFTDLKRGTAKPVFRRRGVSADNHADSRGAADKFFKDLRPGITVFLRDFVPFLLNIAAIEPLQITMSQQNTEMSGVAGIIKNRLGPLDLIVRRGESQRNDQYFLPMGRGELVGGIFQRILPGAVQPHFHKGFFPPGIPGCGKIFVQLRTAVFRIPVAKIVIAGTDDVGDLPVQPLQCPGNGLPLLRSGLVVPIGKTAGQPPVLVHQITGQQNLLDTQTLLVIDDPAEHNIQNPMITAAEGVALSIAHHHHGPVFRIGKTGQRRIGHRRDQWRYRRHGFLCRKTAYRTQHQ